MTVLGGRMFGRCLGHEAGDLRNGIGTYIRDSRETPSLTHHVRYKEKVLVMNQEWHVDIGIPAPRTVKNKFLLFKLPSLWYVGIAAPGNQYRA